MEGRYPDWIQSQPNLKIWIDIVYRFVLVIFAHIETMRSCDILITGLEIKRPSSTLHIHEAS